MNYSNPLLVLFHDLRKVGLPLDIDSLALLLRTWEGGFGLESPDAFERVCRTLWVKDKEQAELLRRGMRPLREAFEQLRAKRADNLSNPTKRDSEPSQDVPPDTSSIPATPKQGGKTSQLQGKDEAKSSTNAQSPASTTSLAKEERSYRAVYTLEDIEALRSVSGQFRHGDCLPISHREMQKVWHNLRTRVREGAATELDIDATLASYGRRGPMFEPTLRPPLVNRASLLLCIDHDGSMVPFHALGQRLAETVKEGRLGNADIYYFCNWPGEWLFHDTGHRNASAVDEVLARINAQTTHLVVFSDFRELAAAE